MNFGITPKNTWTTLVAGLCCLLSPSHAIADQLPGCGEYHEASGPLTLSNAIDSALCLNARTNTAWATIKVQNAQVGIARAAYLPSVNGSVTTQANSTRYPGTPYPEQRVTGYSSSLGLNWRLFDFGERAAQNAAADKLLSAALSSYDDAVRKTLSEVIQAYFSALQTNATFVAKKQAVSLSEKTLAVARQRESKGVAGRSDTLQAEASVARARLAFQRAMADFNKAIASLVYAMGAPSNTPISLPESAPIVPRNEFPELPVLLANVRVSHPAILAAHAQRDASEDNVDVARAQGRPTIDLNISNFQNGYPNQSVQATRSNTVSAGITLTIPIFDGFSRKNKINQAKAEAEKSAAQAEDVEHQILGDLVKSYSDVTTSAASVEASQAFLKAASASLDSATNRYERGVSDILELLTAQNTLVDALEASAQSTSQWNSARLKLMVDSGRIGRDQIIDQRRTTPYS
ncbi:TolC family protein [Neisseriaceae bacterium JH1-16]|nr:TolC family protein [Neisseriaceae bacterium JH1-16]